MEPTPSAQIDRFVHERLPRANSGPSAGTTCPNCGCRRGSTPWWPCSTAPWPPATAPGRFFAATTVT